MILNDLELIEFGKNGLLTPFNKANVNPCSIDLTLGNHFVNISKPSLFTRFIHWLTGKQYKHPEHRLNKGDVFRLRKHHSILATTGEYVNIPRGHCAVVYLKSSAARNGLDHALAGWVDECFHGELTLEFHAHKDVDLIIGKCYVQLVVMKMTAPAEKPYTVTGRYVGQTGATKARD